MFECRNNTENVDPKELKAKNGRTILSSKCSVCGGKTSRFMKEQEASGLLSSFDIKTPLSDISVLSKKLF